MPPPPEALLPAARPAQAHAPAPLPSDQLLQGRKAVELRHNGSASGVQATKVGKLTVTK